MANSSWEYQRIFRLEIFFLLFACYELGCPSASSKHLFLSTLKPILEAKFFQFLFRLGLVGCDVNMSYLRIVNGFLISYDLLYDW